MQRMRYRVLWSAIMCLAFLAPVAHAQEAVQPPEATMTGSTLEGTLEVLRSWALQARDGEHLPTLKDNGKDAAIHEERTKLAARMTEYRRDCRADLRKANRDSKLATTLRCFRGTLSLQLTTLQRWERFTAELPGIPPSIALREQESVRAWIDAIGTVISAVDADVYQAEQGLLDVRARLVERYALPAEYARLRSRRALDAGWLLSTLDVIATLRPAQDSSALAIEETAQESAQCLAEILPEIEVSAPANRADLQAIGRGVAEYEAKAPLCLTKLQNIIKDIIQERQNSGG